MGAGWRCDSSLAGARLWCLTPPHLEKRRTTSFAGVGRNLRNPSCPALDTGVVSKL
jgi:hypothetical protein